MQVEDYENVFKYLRESLDFEEYLEKEVHQKSINMILKLADIFML